MFRYQVDLRRVQLTVFLSVLLAAFAWLTEGYGFPHENHSQELLPILALLDKTLYANDFAVQSFLEPTPRYFYQLVVVGICNKFGLSISEALFTLNILAHSSFYLGVVVLARTTLDLLEEEKSGWSRLDLLLCISFGVACTLPLLSWGSDIFFGHAIPSTFAMAIAIWAPTLAIRGAWCWAFATAGISILMQFLVGLYAGLVLIPALAFHAIRSGRWMQTGAAITLWIAPAIVIYAMMLIHRGEIPESFDFLEVFGFFRVPHHWLPSTGSASAWLSDLMLVISALIALHFLLRNAPKAKFYWLSLGGILAVAVIAVAINYIFVEIIPVTVIGKLQFQRIMPFGHLAVFLLLISAVSQAAKLLGRQSPQIWSVALAVVLATPSIFAEQIGFSYTRLLTTIAMGALLYLFVLSDSTRRRGLIALSSILIFSFVNSNFVHQLPSALSERLQKRYHPFEPTDLPGDRIFLWAREHTSKDALIMIPPDWNDVSDFFSLQSRRSVFFSFKNGPFSDHALYEWSQRGEVLLGVPLSREIAHSDIKELWRGRSVEKIVEIARSNEVCYLVDRSDHRPGFPGKALISQEIRGEAWTLWKLEHCT